MIQAYIGALGSTIQALGTICAALIVGVAGGLISVQYSKEKDRQEKESQWRQHAIELAKLDMQRKLDPSSDRSSSPIRPSVLDFLANYRDLKDLDSMTPRDLYQVILEKRISKPTDTDSASKGKAGKSKQKKS